MARLAESLSATPQILTAAEALGVPALSVMAIACGGGLGTGMEVTTCRSTFFLPRSQSGGLPVFSEDAGERVSPDLPVEIYLSRGSLAALVWEAICYFAFLLREGGLML